MRSLPWIVALPQFLAFVHLADPGHPAGEHAGGITARRDLQSIDGRSVDPLDLARFELYLLAAPEIDRKIDSMLADDEIRLRVVAGVDAAEFAVNEKDVRRWEEAQRKLHERLGTTLEAQLAKRGESLDAFRKELRETVRVDNALFGGLPKTWTERTRKALLASGICRPIDPLRSVLMGTMKPSNPMWRSHAEDPQTREKWRRIVLASVRRSEKVRSACDGLPADEVLRVGSQVWKTRDAMRELTRPRTNEDILDARSFFVATHVLRHALESSGHWGTDEGARQAYEKERVLRPLDTHSEAERIVWRIERAYEHRIADEIDAAALRAHAEAALGVLGRARVSADVLRFAIEPGETVNDTLVRASAWLDELAEGTESFESQARKACAQNSVDKLEIRNALVSEVQHAIGETQLGNFVRGYSAARALFGEHASDVCFGPLRGEHSVLVVLKLSQSPPEWKTIEPATLRRDYVRTRFLAWAAELLARVRLG
ncbi:MAG: hypothetical protein H6832_09065 [Planctomycetes bacterium]|nr:hypothetical protein [Planctomycetota bacterium]